MNPTRSGRSRLAALLLAAAAACGSAHAAPALAPQDPRAAPLSAPELSALEAAAAGQLRRKDYAGVIATAQRYVKAGGPEAQVRPLLVQAYYGARDYANAARELQWEIQAADRSGRPPGEDRLLLLQSCYQRLDDANAYAWGLEKLVTYYPKREYWADLLDRAEKRPDFGERLLLDVNRLRLLTGTLAGAANYLAMAGQARQAGFPAEAQRVIALGFAKGVLGTGPDAARHRQLQRELADETRAQQRHIGQPDVERTAERARDGMELFDLGFAHVTMGDYAKGLPLMEQGLRKGGLANRPQHAKLHLGIAYLMAGQTAKAVETFNTVTGRHGAADLGRIWSLYARNTE